MKVPDKIYVHEISAEELTENFPYHVCYIRKDALLEWAKEAHDSGPIKDSADKGDAWSIGYLCSTADLIDKLNTL